MTNSTEIVAVLGRRVWDSRGRPTVEAELRLAGGAVGRAIAPAGASRGRHEAIDLRDGGAPFGGFDVTRAVANVDGEIAGALVGLDAADQVAVDAALIALDGTADKARLGGNATIAVSMAALHATAAARGVPVLCFAHVTNLMGQSEGDFEKGEGDGAASALALIGATARAWRDQAGR